MKPEQKLADLEIKKVRAKELWLKSVNKTDIAKELGLRKQTIYNWAKDGNWDNSKIEVTNKVMQNLDIDIIKEKERSMKLIRATEGKYAQELQSAVGMPKSTSQFAQLQRVKWEILMPKTVSQFNFMKQENKVELKHPDLMIELIKELNGNSQNTA